MKRFKYIKFVFLNSCKWWWWLFSITSSRIDSHGYDRKWKQTEGGWWEKIHWKEQNLPESASGVLNSTHNYQMTYPVDIIHHRWKHMTCNLLSSVFPVLCFWTQKQSWERSELFMFACVKKDQVRLIYPQRKWRCYNDQLFLTGECVSYKTSPPLMERRTKIDISNSEIIKSDWQWNLH